MYNLYVYDEDKKEWTLDSQQYATMQCAFDVITALARVINANITMSIYGGIRYFTGKAGRYAIKHEHNINMPR